MGNCQTDESRQGDIDSNMKSAVSENPAKKSVSNPPPVSTDQNHHHLLLQGSAEKVDLMNPCPTIVSDAYKKLQAGLSQQEKSLLPGLPNSGPFKYKDGSTYEGQFKDGKRHGYGKQVGPLFSKSN